MISPSRKIAVPAPVPSVSTISTPRPSIAPKPWTSASLSTRTGFPKCSASTDCKSKPANLSVPRFGAVTTRPSRTYPGKPTDTRSKVPSGAVTWSIARTRSTGARGFGGVGTRWRSPIMFPASSTSAALIPVPPISIASVRGSFIVSLFLPSITGVYHRDVGCGSAAGSALGSSPFVLLYCLGTPDRNGAGMRIAARLKGMWVLTLILGLFATTGARAAGPPPPADLVKGDLVAETVSIAPGATLWVALHLEIKAGWHIYWRNPGDSGLPTAIDWKLPPGVSAGQIVWPVPEHFVQNGIGNYGYAGTTDLLVPITVPDGLGTAQTAQLAAEASWLVCADICIPGSAEYTLSLPLTAQPPAADPTVASLFMAARARLPVPASFETRFTSGARDFRLLVPSAALARLQDPTAMFFPSGDSLIDAAAEPRLSRQADGLELILPKTAAGTATPATLDGVLLLRAKDGAERAFEISANPTLLVPADRTVTWWQALLLAFLGGLV